MLDTQNFINRGLLASDGLGTPWDTLRAVLETADKPDLMMAIEELTVIASGLAVTVAAYEQQDVQKVLDEHYEIFHNALEEGQGEQ